MIVIFDVVGTLFSLNAVRTAFEKNSLRSELCDLWFSKVLQSAMASTLASRYIPFKVVAESTLSQVFAIEDIVSGPQKEILAALDALDPYEDAADCLASLAADGHRLVALTNSGREDTEQLLKRHGLFSRFERIYSADYAKRCKPHPAPYELLLRAMLVGPYECCMVAAHGWDILGAQSLGMMTVYVNRLERQWPFPGSPAGFVVENLRDVPLALSDRFGGAVPRAA